MPRPSPSHPGHDDSSGVAIPPDTGSLVTQLRELALAGVGQMYLPEGKTVVQTMRGLRSRRGTVLAPEGTNDRYAAIVALGLSRMEPDEQRTALAGSTAHDLALATADRATDVEDLGIPALAAWAAAEAAGEPRTELFQPLARNLSGDAPIPTVIAAWALTAALATDALQPSDRGRLDDVIRWATRRLLAAQGPHGLFPHHMPAAILGRWRAHVGCFADQVYPIQALARLAVATGNDDALKAAEACAAQICRVQGDAGQWWWHYDVRDGSVVEGFPVYSVHQHAMAPMALADLAAAGGTDHSREISAGLGWLRTHPEVLDELIAPAHRVVWRKVGRREPPKAVRSLAAALTSIRPGTAVPGADTLFPPTVIDHECRPYEFGWLLYAWSDRGAGRIDGAVDGD